MHAEGSTSLPTFLGSSSSLRYVYVFDFADGADASSAGTMLAFTDGLRVGPTFMPKNQLPCQSSSRNIGNTCNVARHDFPAWSTPPIKAGRKIVRFCQPTKIIRDCSKPFHITLICLSKSSWQAYVATLSKLARLTDGRINRLLAILVLLFCNNWLRLVLT
jgi:hypothetical protein